MSITTRSHETLIRNQFPREREFPLNYALFDLFIGSTDNYGFFLVQS